MHIIRVRKLESFTLPLTPLESLEELENFVNRWLRLQAYLNNVAKQLQDLWHEKKELFFDLPSYTNPNPNSDLMDIEDSRTDYLPYFDINIPSHKKHWIIKLAMYINM